MRTTPGNTPAERLRWLIGIALDGSSKGLRLWANEIAVEASGTLKDMTDLEKENAQQNAYIAVLEAALREIKAKPLWGVEQRCETALAKRPK